MRHGDDHGPEAFPDAARRLHAFIRNDAAALCDFPFDIDEIHRLANDDRSNFNRYWTDRCELANKVEAFIAQGIGEGDFIDVNVALAARSVLANDDAVQNWYRPAGLPGFPGCRRRRSLS